MIYSEDRPELAELPGPVRGVYPGWARHAAPQPLAADPRPGRHHGRGGEPRHGHRGPGAGAGGGGARSPPGQAAAHPQAGLHLPQGVQPLLLQVGQGDICDLFPSNSNIFSVHRLNVLNSQYEAGNLNRSKYKEGRKQSK